MLPLLMFRVKKNCFPLMNMSHRPTVTSIHIHHTHSQANKKQILENLQVNEQSERLNEMVWKPIHQYTITNDLGLHDNILISSKITRHRTRPDKTRFQSIYLH